MHFIKVNGIIKKEGNEKNMKKMNIIPGEKKEIKEKIKKEEKIKSKIRQKRKRKNKRVST